MTKLASLLAVVVALTGCATVSPITSGDITPRTELLLRFASPHAITFKSPSGEALSYDDVTQIQGRMVALHADSITLGTTRAERGAGWQQFGQGTTATFGIADVHIQEVQRHPGRTIALVTFLALGLVLLLAVATYEEPPPPPPPEPKPKA